MFNKTFVPFFLWIEQLLNNPKRVLYICVLLTFISLSVDGTLFNLWGFHFKIKGQQNSLAELEIKTKQINSKIKKASQPDFIEKQARERFDMANEGDLIFVFSDSSSNDRQKTSKN